MLCLTCANGALRWRGQENEFIVLICSVCTGLEQVTYGWEKVREVLPEPLNYEEKDGWEKFPDVPPEPLNYEEKDGWEKPGKARTAPKPHTGPVQSAVADPDLADHEARPRNDEPPSPDSGQPSPFEQAARRLEAEMMSYVTSLKDGVPADEAVRSFFSSRTEADMRCLFVVPEANPSEKADTKKRPFTTCSLVVWDRAAGKLYTRDATKKDVAQLPALHRPLHTVSHSGREFVMAARWPPLAIVDWDNKAPYAHSLHAALSDRIGVKCAVQEAEACLVKQLENKVQSAKMIEPGGDDTFMIPAATKDWLATLRGPFHIVPIIGTLRDGKSYFLSTLVRHITGDSQFAFGVSAQYHTYTKGADVCAVQRPGGGTVLFMDVEGTDSVDKTVAYDARLFSSVFLMSQMVLYNCKSIPNNAKQLGALQCWLEIAKTSVPKTFSRHLSQSGNPSNLQAKKMFILCRDTLQPERYDDTEHKRTLLANSMEGFFHNFGDVSLHLFGHPADTVRENSHNLLDKQFNELNPFFANPLELIAEEIARDLLQKAPLSVASQVIYDGATLAQLLENLLETAKDKKYADLSTAAEMLQNVGINNATKSILSNAEARQREVMQTLPVSDRAMFNSANGIRLTALTEYDKLPFINMDREVTKREREGLSKRLSRITEALTKENDRVSSEKVEAAFWESYNELDFTDFRYVPPEKSDFSCPVRRNRRAMCPAERYKQAINGITLTVTRKLRSKVATEAFDRCMSLFMQHRDREMAIIADSAERQKAVVGVLDDARGTIRSLQQEKDSLGTHSKQEMEKLEKRCTLTEQEYERKLVNLTQESERRVKIEQQKLRDNEQKGDAQRNRLARVENDHRALLKRVAEAEAEARAARNSANKGSGCVIA